MSKTRAIRFSEAEDKRIDEFLKRNPIFDFSTLAKTAINRFVENPELTLRAVKTDKSPSKRKDAHVSI